MATRAFATSAVLLLLLALVPLGHAYTAGGPGAPGTIVVAVLDTGVDPYHQEFGGYNLTNHGNFVAWWDFTPTFKSKASKQDPWANAVNGQIPLWDPFVKDPYDDHGHGTGTASLVAGLDKGNCADGTPKTSYAPGVKLAILKVIDKTGSADPVLIAQAIDYATDVVHADIISMSIGIIVPVPEGAAGGLMQVTKALAHARAAGTLPVVAAGNGIEDFGLFPAPSETMGFAGSPDSLIVGGGNITGTNPASTTSNDDPEVAAWSDAVCIAKSGSGAGYVVESGTSFATPLVAGMAATCIAEAKAAGMPADPDTVENVLKHAARDTVLPYAREGWGFLGAPEAARAEQACATGTVPTYTPYGGAPVNANALYETAVADTARTAFAQVTWDPITARVLLPGPGPGSGPGVLAPSGPAGAYEIELYALPLQMGQTATLKLGYGPYASPALDGVQDIDLYVYAPGASADGILLWSEIAAQSTNAAGVPEAITLSAHQTGTYEVAVVAYTLAAPQPFVLTSSAPLAFASERWATGQNEQASPGLG